MERDYSLLKMLLAHPSPSGSESEVIKHWASFVSNRAWGDKGMGKKCYEDKLGQVGFSLGIGPTKIVLAAHIDSVFARVSYIDSHGLIHIKHTGGTDRESFLCGDVIILGKKGFVHGIVGKAPIHLKKEQKEHKYDDLKEIVINIGCETKEEAIEKGVIPGVSVIYDRNTNLEFGENKMHAAELDDKIGVYIITKIMDSLCSLQFESWMNKYTVIVVPLCQEEVGGMGAIRVAKNLNPDICFNFDVDHAQDYNQIGQTDVGDIELGKGGIIQYGCDKSQRIIDLLTKICDENAIPYQTNASKNKGTDTVKFQTETTDCETMLISIPNIYMHTSVEVCDWRDVDSIINMVTKTIQSCEL